MNSNEHAHDPSPFACVDPCAWLVIGLYQRTPSAPSIIKTLDCHGWLREDGKPDMARASREIAAQIKFDRKAVSP